MTGTLGQTAYGVCTPGSTSPSSGGLCGPVNGNAICPDSQCCSVSGFCGTTEVSLPGNPTSDQSVEMDFDYFEIPNTSKLTHLVR